MFVVDIHLFHVSHESQFAALQETEGVFVNRALTDSQREGQANQNKQSEYLGDKLHWTKQ